MNALVESSPFRLLLIHNDPFDRQICRQALERSGYSFSIIEAETAENGLRLVQSESFDCLILNYGLPDFDGLEFLAELRESKGELPVPVVMLTYANDAAIAARALRLGASDCVVKGSEPDSLEWVAATVIKTLRERQSIREKQDMEEKLRKAEAKFQSLAEQIPAITYIASLEEPGKLLFVSPQAAYLGYPLDAWLNDPEGLLRWIHPDDRELAVEEFARTYEHHVPLYCEYRILSRDGRASWLLDEAHVVRGEDGQGLFLQGILVDITHAKELQRDRSDHRPPIKECLEPRTSRLLRERKPDSTTRGKLVLELRRRESAKMVPRAGEAYFRKLLASAGEGIFGLGADGCCNFVNSAGAELFGYSPEQLEGRNIFALLQDHRPDGESPVGDEYPLKHTLLRSVPSRFIEVLRRSDGSSSAVEFSAHPMLSESGAGGAVMVARDVTEAQALTRKLSYEASHDALTGLLNRAEFERRLAKALVAAREDYSEHVLCFLDLDHFKTVNDTCGHAAGDQLLQSLGRLLESRLRQSDTLARLGGDEFGLLLEHCPLEQAWAIANELREAVRNFRFTWDREEFSIGMSIGIMPLNAASGEVRSILNAADTACYAAKKRGRNRVHIMETAYSSLTVQSLAESNNLGKLFGKIPNEVLTAAAFRAGSSGNSRIAALRLKA